MQQRLFEMPDTEETVTRQIATLFYSAADEYGYPPLSVVHLGENKTATFVLRAEDGHQYAVAVTRVENLVGDMRQ